MYAHTCTHIHRLYVGLNSLWQIHRMLNVPRNTLPFIIYPTLARWRSRFSFVSSVSLILWSKAWLTTSLCLRTSCCVWFRTPLFTPRRVEDAFLSFSVLRMLSLENPSHWLGVTLLSVSYKYVYHWYTHIYNVWRPCFFGVNPTYGVLLYSII